MGFLVRLAQTQVERDAALEVRRVVFIVGQNVAYGIDRDGLDATATHVIAEANEQVVATGRFVPQPGVEGAMARVGRMAVLETYRNQGIATAMLKVLENEARRQGLIGVELHSQAYVQKLYGQVGYRTVGEPFKEAGILHVSMSKQF